MTKEGPPKTPYKVFTRRFDVETDWRQLPGLLARRPFYIKAVDSPVASDEHWMKREWTTIDRAQPDWRQDLRRAAAVVAGRLTASCDAHRLADTTITILLDQSGSMKGDKIRYVAAAFDILQAMLTGLGVKVEILGFTTRFWRGGRSRFLWKLIGRLRRPGRLNDLLHIVYRDAAELPAGETPYVFREMVRPEILKENVDGEALEWAARRLRGRPEQRKILLVVSDGAPVDDSTLLQNHSHYMMDHLLDVIAALEATGDIELHGFGVGYDVEAFYAHSEAVAEPKDIGLALIGQIERLLAE
ncbi:MAG: hypothetical protein Q7U20_02945 [Caulobacter sp.]|nr:hypothetical protein [Caulobacter sp.]